MGCFGSRFDKRNSASGDLNTVGTQFVGGEGYVWDWCPVDKICLGEKDLAEAFHVSGLTLSDEEFGQEVGSKLYKAVKSKLDWLNDKYGAPQDGKEVIVADKYDLKKAVGDCEAILKALTEGTGVKVEEEKKEGEGEGMEGEGEEKKEGEEMEGGDEGEEKLEAAPAWDPYEGDGTDYSGFGNLPALLCKIVAQHSYIGDQIKAQLLKVEFNFGEDYNPMKMDMGSFNPMKLVPGGDADFTDAAGLLSAAVDGAGTDKKQIFLAGCAGEQDWGALEQMVAEKADILFPGVTAGWESKEDAMKFLGDEGKNADQTVTKVLYDIEGPCVAGSKCRLFSTRLGGTIESVEDGEDGVKIIKVTVPETPLKHKFGTTIEEWKKGLEEFRNAKPEEEKKEGEGEGEMMMEGEGEMMGE